VLVLYARHEKACPSMHSIPDKNYYAITLKEPYYFSIAFPSVESGSGITPPPSDVGARLYKKLM